MQEKGEQKKKIIKFSVFSFEGKFVPASLNILNGAAFLSELAHKTIITRLLGTPI